MDINLYDMIFKRKSFHLFKNIGNEHITEDELKDIQNKFNNFKPLVDDIRVKMKIVRDLSSCNVGQEYCILLYSEKKDNYLQNIGYIGEQLDLYLVSKNIGSLWYGLGNVEVKEEKLDGLDFVIMFAIAKVDSIDKFRKDMYKSRRKELKEIWDGDNYLEIADIVRFAPSACNLQPWKVYVKNNFIDVYRCLVEDKTGIIPKGKNSYFSMIDIGIFLCFLELCLNKNNLIFDKMLYVDENVNSEKNLVARYSLLNK